ncbi:hypothetical protein PTSG_05581 [Salpingoeca rosetta]|uniref:Uncharacterized protein n=1 Tax=Salpingoeca rosetta (strain ATCC 50818 / BSB-021) TaxID=946362 RepID=F2UBM0_SALR5|nr:uncharacterized protein PTSG_05581 [Salpingoeca rosetta]EGD73886.1 hypothetical protein PTSG_05581 [Salpingoeca rosetta]|eukprot:XP_004993449.1 hypothetical protein PTSG_05581 [Salpingoeca rosetta]
MAGLYGGYGGATGSRMWSALELARRDHRMEYAVDGTHQYLAPEAEAKLLEAQTRAQKLEEEARLHAFRKAVLDRVREREEQKRQKLLALSQRAARQQAEVLRVNSDYHDYVERNAKAIHPVSGAEMTAQQRHPTRHRAAEHLKRRSVSEVAAANTARSLPCDTAQRNPHRRTPARLRGMWNNEERLVHCLQAIEAEEHVLQQQQQRQQHLNDSGFGDEGDVDDEDDEVTKGSLQGEQPWTDWRDDMVHPFWDTGAVRQELERQKRAQFGLYRRVYMDRERAQVRAHRQQTQHAAEIEEMKKWRELHRRMHEN